jgi:AraC family transcriptional activator of pobA
MGTRGKNLYDSNMPAARDRILSFGLFGESAHLPDVMHCETIAARAVRHHWELAPHRHARLHQVLLIESGGGTALVEEATLRLAPRALLNLPTGCVHGFRFQPGTEGYVVTMPDELVDASLADSDEARPLLRQPCLARADAATRQVIRQIWREFRDRSPARAQVLRGLCATLLGLTARALARAAPVAPAAAEPPLLRRFEALLEQHFADHWKVADYARALGVTSTHLSRITRAARGVPASALIAARLMREARRHLAYTSMNVATVADALGFSDPAYFSRAFARTVGLSPRAFRARLAARATAGPAAAQAQG